MVAESDSPVEASDMWHSVSSFTKDWALQGTRQTSNAQSPMQAAPGASFEHAITPYAMRPQLDQPHLNAHFMLDEVKVIR